MISFPLFLTLYAGFVHAFEADHLLAVSTLVSRRRRMTDSILDGICWGLGHASTILLIGSIVIIGKSKIPATAFSVAEALVGAMLILLAVQRFVRRRRTVAILHGHAHTRRPGGGHQLAYGVGIIHGLAGSGALVLLVMTQTQHLTDGLLYLLIFAAGCIGGMLLAAGLFGIPFSRKIVGSAWLRKSLTAVSALLCIGYGIRIIWMQCMA